MTGGTWVRPGGVVIEPTFANALGVHTGDTVDISGHRLRVVGTAVTAARSVYPNADWRYYPGSPLVQLAGLVWVDNSEIGALTGTEPLSYTLNLRFADPHASTSFRHETRDGIEYTSWMQIDDADGRLVKQAHLALLVGSWLRRPRYAPWSPPPPSPSPSPPRRPWHPWYAPPPPTPCTRWPTPPHRRAAAGGASGCPAECPPPY
jgi:hypothetical protein